MQSISTRLLGSMLLVTQLKSSKTNISSQEKIRWAWKSWWSSFLICIKGSRQHNLQVILSKVSTQVFHMCVHRWLVTRYICSVLLTWFWRKCTHVIRFTAQHVLLEKYYHYSYLSKNVHHDWLHWMKNKCILSKNKTNKARDGPIRFLLPIPILITHEANLCRSPIFADRLDWLFIFCVSYKWYHVIWKNVKILWY